MAAAVETASGRQALVVGKPSPYMFECITEHFSVDPGRTLMVGDRLETDILFLMPTKMAVAQHKSNAK